LVGITLAASENEAEVITVEYAQCRSPDTALAHSDRQMLPPEASVVVIGFAAEFAN